MLNNYIEQLIIDLEINEKVTTEDKNKYIIPIDQNINVTIKNMQPGCSLSTKIAPIPEYPCQEILSQIMNGNLFGQGTGEAILGIDNAGKMLTLSQEIPYDIEYQEFTEYLEDFVNYAAFWQETIEESIKEK